MRRFYVALGERARPELRARGAREWLDRLDVEHANVRASLEHLLESGDADGALRLSGAIWLYWQTRGHWTEGRRFLTAAVALGADLEPERLVDSLWGGALLALWQGDIRRRRAAGVPRARDLEDCGGSGACVFGGDPPACDRRGQTG